MKLIKTDKCRAEELAKTLPKVTMIYGDGTNHELLLEEGIESMDAFVTLTGNDEENIIVSMYANKQNVRKIITKINRDELFCMLKEVGIHNNVSPKDIIAARVFQYIRALANKIS